MTDLKITEGNISSLLNLVEAVIATASVIEWKGKEKLVWRSQFWLKDGGTAVLFNTRKQERTFVTLDSLHKFLVTHKIPVTEFTVNY